MTGNTLTPYIYLRYLLILTWMTQVIRFPGELEPLQVGIIASRFAEKTAHVFL